MDSDTRITYESRGGLFMAWALAIFVTAFLGLVVFLGLRELSWPTRPDLGGLVGVIFGGLLALAAAGLVALIWRKVLRASLLSRRYGDSVLELSSTPSRLGGRLQGRVRIAAPLASDEAVNVAFQCWGNRHDGGDSGSTSQLRWDSETLFSAEELGPGTGELTVPIDLAVPTGPAPTGPAEGGWETTWTLKVSFEPDIGYAPAFDIPVERAEGRALDPAEAAEPFEPVRVASHRRIASEPGGTGGTDRPPTRPPHARLRVEPSPEGGLAITLPRKLASTILAGWCIITLPLWVFLPFQGLAELEMVESPPAIAYLIQLGIAFGVSFVLNGLPLLGMAFENRGLRVGPDGVVVKRLLRKKRFPAGHFTYAEASGNSNGGWLVSLERSPTAFLGGLGVTVVTTEAEARWLVEELGLALDVRR